MKFSYIALFLVIALIAAFAYAEDGTKGEMTVKLDTKLTDAQLDSDAFWKFDGTFMQSLYATFAGDEEVTVFIQYALNKKAVEVTMWAAPGVEVTNPTKEERELLLQVINGLIPEAQNNKATSLSASTSKLDADCFNADGSVTPECSGGDGTCEKDSECINFSICVFTCKTDADCTVDGETCIKEEGETEGECGVVPPVDKTCKTDADCTVDGETCIKETEDAEEGECGVAPVDKTCKTDADCTVDGETCIKETEDAEEGECGVEDDTAAFRALQDAKGKCSKREAKNSASATTVALTFAMTIAMAALMIA